MKTHPFGAATVLLAIAIVPMTPYASKAKAKAVEIDQQALAEAKLELSQLQMKKDSLAAQRWSLRKLGMDARESWQVVYERSRDSLDSFSSRRNQLLGDIETLRMSVMDKKPPEPVSAKFREKFRQEMIDRSGLLMDRIRFGLPWEQAERLAPVQKLQRGLAAYSEVEEGIAPLFSAYVDEWKFSRSIESRKGNFARADGSLAEGQQTRIAALGGWYLTSQNQSGLLAQTGPAEAPWAWHENLHPATQKAIITGIQSRELELPVDPMGTQAVGAGYFPEVKKPVWSRLLDMKEGPLAKMALWVARAVLVLLVVLGLMTLFVAWRRSRLVGKEEADADAMRVVLSRSIAQPENAKSISDHADGRTVAGRLVKTGFENMELAPEALEQVLVAQESVEQRELEQGLNFLATVAANAAFIGLLGTVCGILDAFGHLGSGGDDAATLVMAAIAEALIATAVGLAVAIPAVVFYNNLNHHVRKVLDEAKELRHLLLAVSLDAVARKNDLIGSTRVGTSANGGSTEVWHGR